MLEDFRSRTLFRMTKIDELTVFMGFRSVYEPDEIAKFGTKKFGKALGNSISVHIMTSIWKIALRDLDV